MRLTFLDSIWTHLCVVHLKVCVIKNACMQFLFLAVQMPFTPPGLSTADRPERKKKGDG